MKQIIKNHLIGDTARFIHTALGTKGKLTQVEVTLMPGGGTPLHFHHKFCEKFTVVDGVLYIELKGRRQHILQPGESFSVDFGVLHRFHNPTSKPIKFIVTIEPASTGFEYALRIMYGLAKDGLTNKNSTPKRLSHIGILLVMGDINAKGLPSLLFPLIKCIAQLPRNKNIEKDLIKKYCN